MPVLSKPESTDLIDAFPSEAEGLVCAKSSAESVIPGSEIESVSLMERPMKIVLFALIVSGSLALVQAQTKAPATPDETVATRDQAAEQELKDLELKENQQALAGDTSAFDKSVASDYVGMNSGVMNGKLMVLSQDKAALEKDVKGTSSMLADANIYDLDARVHGNTGIVRGRAVVKLKNGKSMENNFLDVWEKRNGQWVQVAAATAIQQTN